MYKNKSIGVIVPALNEERFISIVVTGVPKYTDRIYVIDDGSTDATYEIASELAEGNPKRIRVIKHEQNLGVGKSVVTGYKSCLSDNLDIAIVMAGDNQMNPDNIPKLLDPIVEGKADFSSGDRLSYTEHARGMSPWRQLGNRILKWLTRIAAWNFDISDPQNGYNAITSKMLMRLDLDRIYPRYGYLNDMLVKLTVAGARIAYVPMPCVYGSEISKIRYWHYIPSLLWLLLKAFLWRIKAQLLRRDSSVSSNTPDTVI
jgi:glycosyltransferase involved in cell wall biosynthesis